MTDGPKSAPHTVLRPNPGGRRPQSRAAAPGTAHTASQGVADTQYRHGVNPLVDAASELFELVVYLQSDGVTVADVAALRQRVASMIAAFERSAMSTGQNAKVVTAARFAISATIDDAVLNAPWGFESSWPDHTLVSELDETINGGVGFYNLLDKTRSDPVTLRDLLEFLYVCLSLGFRGKYRQMPDGEIALDQLRSAVYVEIAHARHDTDEELSATWRGIDTDRRKIRELIPLWMAGAIALLLIGIMFVVATIASNGVVGKTTQQVALLPFTEEVTIADASPVTEVQIVEPVFNRALYDRICDSLARLEDADLLECLVNKGEIMVRLRTSDMFSSGSASVRRELRQPIRQVADIISTSLEGAPATIRLIGHTDSTPVRAGASFDNYSLSLARANAVSKIVEDAFTRSQVSLETEGMGPSQLIFDPVSGREDAERSRRVDLRIIEEDRL